MEEFLFLMLVISMIVATFFAVFFIYYVIGIIVLRRTTWWDQPSETRTYLDKLKVDTDYDFWHQSFWEPVMAGFVAIGVGVFLFALIGSLFK